MKYLRFILIIAFATLLSYIIAYSFRTVIQLQYELLDSEILPSYWGDIFFFRILASLISTALGGFVIGTFLIKEYKLATLIYSLPIFVFWIFTLINYYADTFDFSFFSRYHIIPLTLTLLSIPIAFLGCVSGSEYQKEFDRPNSVLNIKWYHWLWIFPFLLNQIVSVLVFILTLLWQSPADENIVINLIFNFGNTLSRIITFIILSVLILSARYLYDLLSASDDDSIKLRWLQIIGLVVLFGIVYSVLIGSRIMNLLL